MASQSINNLGFPKLNEVPLFREQNLDIEFRLYSSGWGLEYPLKIHIITEVQIELFTPRSIKLSQLSYFVSDIMSFA